MPATQMATKVGNREGRVRAPGLDGVRALAVLAVIAFHEGLGAAPAGFLGVDVFFVLSGYLITDLLVSRRDLLPAAPLFWAALGILRPPPAEAALFGRAGVAQHVWRYAMARDTMDFVEAGPDAARLLMEVRRAGRIVASLQLTFQPGTRRPGETRVRFPQDGSALIFTVEGITHVAPFEPSTWHHP